MKELLRAFALVWIAVLPGCETTTGSAETKAPTQIVPTELKNSFCAIAMPIPWSQKDTDETILSVKRHNAVGIKLCGWGR